jgi:HlyD family secretion protein
LFQNRTVSASDLEAKKSTSDTASASLREAEAEIAAHQTEVGRSEAALRVAEAEFANAQAAVKQHEALVEQAAFELARTTIRAPIDGVVIERNVDRGQTVAASLESPTLFTLAQDLRRMAVHARVDEAGIGAVRTGQNAAFEVDAFQGRSFAGKIMQIRQAPEVMQNVVTYTVLIEVNNSDRTLLPGMTATVRITVAELLAALAVPNAALRFRADRAPGTAPAVWVIRGEGEPTPIQVKTGQVDERWTQILEGGPIREGDQVVVDDAGPTEGEASALEIRFGL